MRGGDRAGLDAERIAPLYERLPSGPHRLDRREVLRHQRMRMQGAMVEAVARGGYDDTSVRQVTALAGVSRRAFYEQFANREDCFLATFDTIAARGIQRLRRVYLATGGSLQERLGAAFDELAAAAGRDPKAAAFVTAGAQTAGPAAAARLREVTAACERRLAESLTEAPGAGALPMPIARGIAGGLEGTACRILGGAASALEGEGPAPGPEGLAEALLAWTLPFAAVASTGLAERMAANITPRLSEVPSRPRTVGWALRSGGE